MPTSSGKSALFLACATVDPTKKILVFAPYHALIRHILQQCTSRGIIAHEWAPGNTSLATASLVALPWESAGTPAFQQWMDAQGADVSHIFVDEYHVAITESNFRPTIQHSVAQLQRYSVPITYLTATAPAPCFSLFCQALCLPSSIDLYRAPVRRHNISYIIIDTPRDKIIGDVTKFLEIETRELLRSGTKGILFVNSVNIGHQWSALIGCPFHYSGAASKDQILDDFALGKTASPWLVATSGAGTGLDIDNISLVLHIERPHGLVSYVQQSGRCARNVISVGRSVMFLDVSSTRDAWAPSRSTDSFASADQAALTDYISHRGCRQEPLESFLDSTRAFKSCIEAVAVCPMRVVQCDFCDRLTNNSSSASSYPTSNPNFHALTYETTDQLPPPASSSSFSSTPCLASSLPPSSTSTAEPTPTLCPSSPGSSNIDLPGSSGESISISASTVSSSPPATYAPPTSSPGLRGLVDGAQSLVAEYAMMHRMLAKLSVVCQWCYVHQLPPDPSQKPHCFYYCEHLKAHARYHRPAFNEFRKYFRNNLGSKNHDICYSCYLPQDICPHNAQNRIVQCKYPDTTNELMFSLLALQPLALRPLLRKLGCQEEPDLDNAHFRTWLCRPKDIDPHHSRPRSNWAILIQHMLQVSCFWAVCVCDRLHANSFGFLVV